MDTITLLHQRISQPRLAAPAPTGAALDNILKAALNVPDHAALTPWRFVVCEEKGLEKLGSIYQEAAVKAGKTEAEIEKASRMPLRAPMVIVAITQYKAHPKVPAIEQVESTACSVYAMELAAQAQGFGAMWRTGELATNEDVKQAFELTSDDEIVGFLYLGSPTTQPLAKAEKKVSDYVEFWS